MKLWHIYCVLSLSAFSGCVKNPSATYKTEQFVSTEGRFLQSSSAGNLFATAIKEENNLDMAFVPTDALLDEGFALVTPNMSSSHLNTRLYQQVYNQKRSAYRVGTILGRDLEKFILSRTMETLRHDLHVAGLTYDIVLAGGVPQVVHIRDESGEPLEPDRLYRIAVENQAYRTVFPGYYYRQGFNFSFHLEDRVVYAKDSVLSYLSRVKSLKSFERLRSQVTLVTRGKVPGITAIGTIQGNTHFSKYVGKVVTVEGVVTAFGADNEGSRSGIYEGFIQSVQQDNDLRTSEGIYVDFLGLDVSDISVGSLIRATGVVYEDVVDEGLTRTGLRTLSELTVLAQNQTLPRAVMLGEDIKIPNQAISRFAGNLNNRRYLHLDEGLDFWESLEGMRVRVPQPQVVGFAGGRKDLLSRDRPKGYINIFVAAKNSLSPKQLTPQGGVIIDNLEFDYNPEIIRVIDHHLAPSVSPKYVYEVGEILPQDLWGVLGYNFNLFGSGEYTLYVTSGDFNEGRSKKVTPLSDKPKSSLMPTPHRLTVASFNVENLSGNAEDTSGDQKRFNNIGEAIANNLNCPDILNLVEIQDNDGPIDSGSEQLGPDASLTLQRLVDAITCPEDVVYEVINIDPFENAEGGEPGGNIRVAMIYNSNRVSFTRRGLANADTEAYFDSSGTLVANPSRIDPRHPDLKGVRKPLVAEFLFKGEKIIVIGNHFNSKGSDTSLWAANQPPQFKSESKRTKIAALVNNFATQILNKDSEANVIILGDFNDFNESRPLKTLEGSNLENLANVKDSDGQPLVLPNDQYTYNFGGNSQPLDFIIVSENLITKKDPKLEIIHINTDYMGQVSDHDPIIASFEFKP